jgi:hypothetical protein
MTTKNAKNTEKPRRSPSPPAAGWPATVHGPYPPHTGAERCIRCGGWIMSATRYWTQNTGPMCPSCWNTANNQAEP